MHLKIKHTNTLIRSRSLKVKTSKFANQRGSKVRPWLRRESRLCLKDRSLWKEVVWERKCGPGYLSLSLTSEGGDPRKSHK